MLILVTIVGLAAIVTAGSFLEAARRGQDAARLASIKVDIANREDVLMRALLQETATGMLPGTDGVSGPMLTWNAIMTNTTALVGATSYVASAEVTALGLGGIIHGNPADSNQGLGLFAGYLGQETPFGGTSGLANLVPVYNGAVQPPLMNWSANPSLSSVTAVTTPQEFFLGSLNTPGTPLVQSTGHRWAQLNYPPVRFGYKRPGDLFITRRVWWRIPLVYQMAQPQPELASSQARFQGAAASYVLSVYEIPSQLPISGNANLQIGQTGAGAGGVGPGTQWASGNVTLAGSVYGGQVQLYGGTYTGAISSHSQVNINNQATVAGETFADNTFDNLGVRETKDQARLIGAAPGATPNTAPVSVAGNDGKVLLVPVLSGNQFFMAAPNDNPTNWDLYARPYYRCGVRIQINSFDATLVDPNQPNSGNLSVTVRYRTNIGGGPDAILGVSNQSSGWTSVTYSCGTGAPAGLAFGTQSFMHYTSTSSGVGDLNILVVDLSQLASGLGLAPSELYSVYIGTDPTVLPSPDTGIAAGISGGKDLHFFTSGLSVLSKGRLYFTDAFNQTLPIAAASVYAPQIRFGMTAVNPQLNLTGQLAGVASGLTQVNPVSFTSGKNTQVSLSATHAALSEATAPTAIPPITMLNLLFTIEKERTN